jgi:hypothetical protein
MSAGPVIPENHPLQLFVEGNDDVHSIIQFTSRHGCDWSKPPPTSLPHVKAAGSDTQVLRSISAGLKTWHRFGVVIDADEDSTFRWRQLENECAKAGISLPDNPTPDGLVIPGITPDRRFGIWLMPDNRGTGSLEDFLRQMIPADDAIRGHADDSAMKAKDLGAPFRDAHLGKAQLRTWLAWQEQPGLPPGKAIQYKSLTHDNELALRFLSWFQRLFLAS